MQYGKEELRMRKVHMNWFFLNNYHRLGVPEEEKENYDTESLPVSLEMSYVDCLLWGPAGWRVLDVSNKILSAWLGFYVDDNDNDDDDDDDDNDDDDFDDDDFDDDDDDEDDDDDFDDDDDDENENCWTSACTKRELFFGAHTGQLKASDQDMSLDTSLCRKGEDSY